MIRFIDLGNQIYPYDRDRDSFMFAWWDTVTDQFYEFLHEQSWGTWEEFEYDFRNDPANYLTGEFPFLIDEKYLERFKDLFPKDWPNMKRWEAD